MSSDSLVTIEELKLELISMYGLIYAVRNINMDIKKGTIHGIVGESGCGKSMTAKSILRLHDEKKCEYSGRILYKGEDILKMSKHRMQSIRGGEIAMISQDPMTALDPIQSVGKQISEMILLHQKVSKKEAHDRAVELLEKVGIQPGADRYHNYPFEMSGGQLQRVCIAMALACNPELLIADEPTTALDVTMQAQILVLLKQLQKEMDSSILIITHNFGVVAEICDTVSVMYAGQIVETGDVHEIFNHPTHPYTKALISCIPKAGDRATELTSIKGQPPQLNADIVGCPYATRCKYADERCFMETPVLKSISEGHECMCFRSEDRT